MISPSFCGNWCGFHPILSCILDLAEQMHWILGQERTIFLGCTAHMVLGFSAGTNKVYYKKQVYYIFNVDKTRNGLCIFRECERGVRNPSFGMPPDSCPDKSECAYWEKKTGKGVNNEENSTIYNDCNHSISNNWLC